MILYEIRYVGKSNNPEKRLLTHVKHSKDKSHRTSWIKSLKEQNLEPILKVIEECSKDIWQEREVFWIKHYKAQGMKLTNLTDGGGGWSHFSDELREKVSQTTREKWKDPEYRKKQEETYKTRYTEDLRKNQKEFMKTL